MCTGPQDARAEGGGGRLSQRDVDELQQATHGELLQSKGKGRKGPLGLISRCKPAAWYAWGNQEGMVG